MDTKWSNIIDKIYIFIKKSWKQILGVFLIIVGLAYNWEACISSYYHSWNVIFANWFLGNFLLTIGIILITQRCLNSKYERQALKYDWDYAEWKKEIIYVEKRAMAIGVLLVGIAVTVEYVWFYDNLMIITAILQFIIFQIYYLRFMTKYLDYTMAQMDEINRQKLEKALEIERQSLEKVSRSDQLRMDLITNVSHDLKTPLTSMVGYLELVKKEELSPVVRDYIEVIVDKTDKLKEMIESLFSLAKVSSGNVELHMETFQLNRLMEQIMADMKDRIEESELHFVTKFTEEETEIISDNMYCYRICQNLLENALKYAAKETRVFVKTYVKDEKWLCLEMTNTAGYYMDFEKEEILEKFARGDKARSTEGNGLGLAIVSSYARALGGEFDIQIDCDQFKACVLFPKK